MGYVQKVNVAMLAVVAMLVLASCGYHTAGKAARIPDSVHTIAIPVFTNKTPTYRIETVLTNAVVKEFNTRTKYRIVNQAVPDADATLTGTVISTELAPVTYDSQTGRASTALVTVTMSVVLKGRNGQVLYENSRYVFREQYQVSRELSSFFEEEGIAVERLSHDFARTLVSNVLEAF
jgi:outer membrane lipopolysaccharide assembly protein LptE/RlpB